MHFIHKVRERLKHIRISMRTQLLLIYILCVLAPILVFSSAFHSSLVESTKKEKLILFDQSLNRISDQINSHAASAISLSNIIYSDYYIYDYLNYKFNSKAECLVAYNDYLAIAWPRMLYHNTGISYFSIYTHNDTLMSSYNVRRIDSNILNRDWYDVYNKNNTDMVFINHIDPPMSTLQETILVSFIRELDYIHNSEYRHLLKITFQYDMFDRILDSEELPGNTYVINNKNQIIAQSKNSGYYDSDTDFLSFDSVPIDPKQIVLEAPIQAMEGWRVVCVLDKDFMKDEYRTNRLQILVLLFFVTVIASIIILIIAKSLYQRIDILVKHMHKVEEGTYSLIPENKKGNDEIGLLITSANKMTTKIKILIEDVYKAELKQAQIDLLKKQSELNAMQSQVNPHFMFNVLEAIRLKSYLKNEFETARIVKYMSKLFRRLLNWNNDLIELREELKFIKEYLEIQQYRYEDELEFVIDVDESIMGLKIPKMALQTFVDNACEHGLSEENDKKIIKITAKRLDKTVEIKVYDNGKGMDPELIKNIKNNDSSGIGIKNVLGRLNAYYEGNFDFKIRSREGEFTEIIITFDLEFIQRITSQF